MNDIPTSQPSDSKADRKGFDSFCSDKALLTDLYELTMSAAFYENHMENTAVFSLYCRDLPKDRGYYVSAGLESVLDYLENFRFNDDALAYLESTGFFSKNFLSYLSRLTFTGNVRALPEGTVFFPNEPLFEVEAPVIQAQLLETYLLNTLGIAVNIAGKAARCMSAAKGRNLVDFSLRRTHGADAGLIVARSSYIAGFVGTSNVLAGKLYGIPVSGTMAHSFVTAFPSEMEAFRAYYKLFPENTVLLIDTYDPIIGAENAVRIAGEMKEKGYALRGVRIDGGDFAALSKQVRDILDKGGFPQVAVLLSGGFDEYKIADIIEQGASVNGFGVGTRMGVAQDSPSLDMAYKMVKIDDRPVMKHTKGKMSLPCEKQIFRAEENGLYKQDVLGLINEDYDGTPLLENVMEKGRRTAPQESLDVIKNRLKNQLEKLPEGVKTVTNPEKYPVHVGKGVREVQNKLISSVSEGS